MNAPRPGPLVVCVQKGRHALCTCGKSATAPFCDGSHRGTEFRPVLHEVEDLPENIAWCTCRTTSRPPYCDGSHTQLWAPTA